MSCLISLFLTCPAHLAYLKRSSAAQQVRAAAIEAAQRARGAWEVLDSAAAPRPDPPPTRPSSSPAKLQRGGDAVQPMGAALVTSVPQGIIQSPHAIAAVLHDSRSPRAPLMFDSPPMAGDGRPDSPRQGVTMRAAPSAADDPTEPTRELRLDLGPAAPGQDPAEKLTVPPAAPVVLYNPGLPLGPGRTAARRNSHRTLRTLQVSLLMRRLVLSTVKTLASRCSLR